MHFNFYEGGGTGKTPPMYKGLAQKNYLFWVGLKKCNFLPNLQEWHYTINQNVINLTRNFVFIP
jgi:hypothetical protein